VQIVTPDLKLSAKGGALIHVDLAAGRRRLGGSALVQVRGVGACVWEVRRCRPGFLVCSAL